MRETLECLEKSAQQIALVIDNRDKLLGVVTDGDIRRHLLKHGSLNAPVFEVMNKNPKTARKTETKDQPQNASSAMRY